MEVTVDARAGAEPGEVVAAFLAAIERKDLDAALQLVTHDVVYDNVPIGKVFGPEGIRSVLARPLSTSERIEWVVHHQVSEGPRVMNARLDRFLVSGRWVEVPVAGLFVVRDGRIALWRDYFDLASYRAQLQARDEGPGAVDAVAAP